MPRCWRFMIKGCILVELVVLLLLFFVDDDEALVINRFLIAPFST